MIWRRNRNEAGSGGQSCESSWACIRGWWKITRRESAAAEAPLKKTGFLAPEGHSPAPNPSLSPSPGKSSSQKNMTVKIGGDSGLPGWLVGDWNPRHHFKGPMHGLFHLRTYILGETGPWTSVIWGEECITWCRNEGWISSQPSSCFSWGPAYGQSTEWCQRACAELSPTGPILKLFWPPEMPYPDCLGWLIFRQLLFPGLSRAEFSEQASELSQCCEHISGKTVSGRSLLPTQAWADSGDCGLVQDNS